MKGLLSVIAAAGLASCASVQGIPECRSPGAPIAIPEEWNTSEEAVPELAGIEWAKAPRRDGVYLLADGREFRDAKPVKSPAPNFPAAASSQEGVCSIGFSVERDGHTSNIRVSCSDPLFLSAAQSAAENTLFDPARIDQVPVVRNKVVYPLYFCQRN